jgi:hypothetical protein
MIKSCAAYKSKPAAPSDDFVGIFAFESTSLTRSEYISCHSTLKISKDLLMTYRKSLFALFACMNDGKSSTCVHAVISLCIIHALLGDLYLSNLNINMGRKFVL